MKSYFFLLLIFSSSLLVGCKSEQKQPLIERNEEVRSYFGTLTRLIDEYATLAEDLSQEAIEQKNKEEHSLMDGLSIITNVVTSGKKIYDLSKEIEGMEDQHKTFEKNLSVEDFTEFMALYTKHIKRFEEINEAFDAIQ